MTISYEKGRLGMWQEKIFDEAVMKTAVANFSRNKYGRPFAFGQKSPNIPTESIMEICMHNKLRNARSGSQLTSLVESFWPLRVYIYIIYASGFMPENMIFLMS